MPKDKNIYNIFARIGKTEFSSLASEELLKDLVYSINKNKLNPQVLLFQYPIFSFKDRKNYFYYKGGQNTNYIFELPSTSIKLIRDIIFIFQILYKSIKDSNKNIILYNINPIHLNLLSLIYKLINYHIIFIHADGIIIPKGFKNIFNSIIVFSDFAKKFYQNSNFKNVYFSYPTITTMPIKKTNDCSKSISKKDIKTIKLVHCGSISEYNLPSDKLEKLSDLCLSNKDIEVIFTSSQKKIPDYFLKFINKSPENIMFFGNLKKNDLEKLLDDASYGLDLRDTTEIKISGGTDFPSKILLYIKHDLKIISSRSIAIPYFLRKKLIPFESIENCKDEFNVTFDNSIKKHIQENSLDKILVKAIKARK